MELPIYKSRTDAPEQAASGVEKIEVSAVNSAEARELYKKRVPIYPKLVSGKFRTLKWALLAIALAVYYLLPWVRWDRGPNAPDQAVLADFAGSRFYFFFIEIWPQEVYFITGLLVVSALALFMATSLFGRIWCGYACPQTVWTDLFIAVERMLEGDRNKRIKLDRAPWTFDKVWRKTVKHIIWLIIAFATGGVFIMYFHDAPSLARDFFTGQAELSAYLFAGVLTFTTYALAGTMREQVCTYMCPWPRIQAAMLDENSLEVTYRLDRGEPRGPHRKGETWDGRGDCIDCRQCVAACPMGIDIRDGMQLECINCALCIDACDEIMDKIGRPRGLIAYDTDANVKLRAEGKAPVYRLLRPRTFYYAALIGAISLAMVVGLAMRTTLELNVLKDRSPPFIQLSDSGILNGYSVKLLNKADTTRTFTLSVEGPDAMTMTVVGQEAQSPGRTAELTVEPDKVGSFRVFLSMPRQSLDRASTPITLRVQDNAGKKEARENATFFAGPAK
jgi:cytochrome c oxidase accessory protein FixG